MRTKSLNGPETMDLGHGEKLRRQGISNAFHPNLEVTWERVTAENVARNIWGKKKNVAVGSSAVL